MAKIQDWDKIRRTIIVPRYQREKLDLSLIEEITRIEQQALNLRRQLGCMVDIYIPDRHPVIEKDLIRKGKKVEIADVTHCGTHLSEKRNVQVVEFVSEINDLKNIITQRTLDMLRYDGERYQKITCLVCDDREVFRVPGVREENIK